MIIFISYVSQWTVLFVKRYTKTKDALFSCVDVAEFTDKEQT